MATQLGKALRSARQNRTSFSQQELCDEVNRRLGRLGQAERLTQATLSAWETGRQTPSNGSQLYVDTLCEVLEISSQEIAEIVKEDTGTSPSPDNQYVQQVREWLTTVPKAPSEVKFWFIAPNNFPAFSSHEICELWVSNLRNAVEYNLLIIVNWLTDSNSFHQLAALLSTLDSRLEGVPWRLNIYAYHRPEIRCKEDASDLIKDFRELVEMSRAIGDGTNVLAQEITQAPPDELWLSIARVTPDFGRLVILVPEFGALPAASLLLMSTVENYSGLEEPIYRWLNVEACQELRSIVRSISEEWIYGEKEEGDS